MLLLSPQLHQYDCLYPYNFALVKHLWQLLFLKVWNLQLSLPFALHLTKWLLGPFWSPQRSSQLVKSNLPKSLHVLYLHIAGMSRGQGICRLKSFSKHGGIQGNDLRVLCVLLEVSLMFTYCWSYLQWSSLVLTSRGVHRSRTGPDRTGLDWRPKRGHALDRGPDRSLTGPGPDRTGPVEDRPGQHSISCEVFGLGMRHDRAASSAQKLRGQTLGRKSARSPLA